MSLSDPARPPHAIRDFLLTLAALVVILAGARFASNLLAPFLLSVFIAIILSSPIRYLQHHNLPGWLATTLTCIAALGLLGLIFVFLGTTAEAFIGALPGYEEQFQDLTANWVAWLEQHGMDISRDAAFSALNPASVIGFFGGFVTGLGGTLSNIVLILFTVVFILSDTGTFSQRLANGDPDAQARNMKDLQGLMRDMNSYISTKAMVSTLTGVLIGIGLWLLDVRFALLWGFLAFLLNFVPSIGSIVAAVPAVLLSLLEGDPLLTGSMIALYMGVNTLVGNIIEPRWTGHRVGLSTLAVFLSLIFWGWMFGPVGMLLSVPLTMAMRFIAMHQPGSRWFVALVSSTPAASTTGKGE